MRKNIRELLKICFVIILATLFLVSNDSKADKAIKLSKTQCNVIVGKKYNLELLNKTEDMIVTWSSKNDKIASVSQSGIISGIKKGKTSITCKITTGTQQLSLTTKVTVLSKPSNSTYKIRYKEQNSKTYKSRLVITAYKGTKLKWTYYSKYYNKTELDTFSKVVRHNDMIYFREVDQVVTLDAKTGKVIWRAKGCGAGNLVFDNEGNAYIVGYYSPDLFSVDCNGNIRYVVTSYDQELFWAYDIKIKGDTINIYYDCETDKKPDFCTIKKDKYGNPTYCITVDKDTGKLIR